MDITLQLSLRSYTEPQRRQLFEDFLRSMTRTNVRFLRRHPRTPSLFASGVRYRREPDGEIWKDIPTIIADGFDDCEGLACWLAAEIRVAGGRATPKVIRTGPRLYHVVTQTPRGVLDPSKRLGMKGSA